MSAPALGSVIVSYTAAGWLAAAVLASLSRLSLICSSLQPEPSLRGGEMKKSMRGGAAAVGCTECEAEREGVSLYGSITC